MFPSSSSFSGASAGFAGAEPVSTEVHLDERKHEKQRATFPDIFHPAPLTFPPISPFVHYPIYSFNLSRRYIIVAKFLRTKTSSPDSCEERL